MLPNGWRPVPRTMRGTDGWGEKSLETESCQSSENCLKNVPSPICPVHHIKIAKERSFFPKEHGHVLMTLCWAHQVAKLFYMQFHQS
jgi:hypothetical protein